jgi:hypothetical protein
MKRKVLGMMIVLTFFGSLAHADFVNIPPSEFRSWNDDSNQLFMAPSGWAEYCLKDTTTGAIVAPVHLPNGAIIKNMRVMYIDNDGTHNIQAILRRVNMYTGNGVHIFDITSSGLSPSIRTMIDSSAPSGAIRLVSNSVLQYYVMIYFTAPSADLRLYGVVIEY